MLFFRNFLLCFCLIVQIQLLIIEKSFAYDIEKIPLVNEGRVKPLETFASSLLLGIMEKESFNCYSASFWLLEVFLNPMKAYQKKVFKIRNSKVVDALEIKRNKLCLYSYNDLILGFNNKKDFIHKTFLFHRNQRIAK